MITRRSFLRGVAGGAMIVTPGRLGERCLAADSAVSISQPLPDEDVFQFIRRLHGTHDTRLYAQILGAANEFKEGDQIVGVAAADDASRRHARSLLSRTRIEDVDAHPLHSDDLFRFISAARDDRSQSPWAEKSLADLKQFLLASDEAAIKQVMLGLSSDVIACVVKLMSNEELIQLSGKVFNPLPGSQIGAKGYLGARLQPNSPTDNVDDILWQVLDGWSYAVGDVLLAGQ